MLYLVKLLRRVKWNKVDFYKWVIGLLRVCLVLQFKHSFLCLNPENGEPGFNFVCLALVFSFWIQIQILFKWYSNGRNWEQLKGYFGWIQILFKWPVAFLQIFARMTSGIIVIKPIFFFLFLTLLTTSLSVSHHSSSSSSSSHSSLSLLLAWLIFSNGVVASLNPPPTVISLSLSSFSSLSRCTICAWFLWICGCICWISCDLCWSVWVCWICCCWSGFARFFFYIDLSDLLWWLLVLLILALWVCRLCYFLLDNGWQNTLRLKIGRASCRERV